MKIYFDNIDDLTSPNCEMLSNDVKNAFWLTPTGTRLKQELRQLNIPYYKLDNLDEPGLYFVEVNGDPIWWTGLARGDNVPTTHILNALPAHIINLVKSKKLRIIISADREGGPMMFATGDAFKATYDAMINCNLPHGSVLLIQGNQKIEQQYEYWLTKFNCKKLFDVKYVNHFDKIFINRNLPTTPIIYDSLNTIGVKDFNSLNRTFKTHRSAHLYILAVKGWLARGLVSANELKYGDERPLQLATILTDRSNDFIKDTLIADFDSVLHNHYPLYVDGDWSINNAANSVNVDIFKNSLMSFITETKFDEDVVFLTEKVFKCLTYGHPMLVLGACGTLRALEQIGYNIDMCGINPNYNDIEDHYERFIATHRVMEIWINFSADEKIQRIKESLPAIEHNFKLSASRNFYHEYLISTINISKDYFT
jgi:hypothetical protein